MAKLSALESEYELETEEEEEEIEEEEVEWLEYYKGSYKSTDSNEVVPAKAATKVVTKSLKKGQEKKDKANRIVVVAKQGQPKKSVRK